MMTRITILGALALLLGLPTAALAKPGRVDRVIFEGRTKTLDFTVTATKELDASKAEAIPDKTGKVLILRIGGVTAKRRWVKAKDPELKRVLLHASSERPPGAVLRVRFKKKVVNRSLMKRISVFVEDEGIRISVPRPSVPPDMEAKKNQGAKVAIAGTESTPSTNGAAPSAAPSAQTPAPSSQGDVIERVASGSLPDAPHATAAPITPIASVTPPGITPAFPSSATEPVDTAVRETTEEAAPETPAAASDDPPDANGMVFLPGVRTQDVLAGFTDMSLRLETGMKARPGVHRIAVLPFLALDEDAKDRHVGTVSQSVMTNRLTKRTGIVQTDPLLLERTIEPLQRDDMGRFDLDEARAAGVSVGADTLIIGTASSNGNGYTVDTRAIDIQTGKRLGVVSQEFEQGAFQEYVSQVRLEKTYKGTLLRSAAMPGWGQLYQGETGRGAVYMTIFSAALLAGLTSVYLGSSAENTYRSSDRLEDVSLREEANDRYGAANTLFLGSGMVWLTAMIDSAFTGDTQVILDPELYGAVE